MSKLSLSHVIDKDRENMELHTAREGLESYENPAIKLNNDIYSIAYAAFIDFD